MLAQLGRVACADQRQRQAGVDALGAGRQQGDGLQHRVDDFEHLIDDLPGAARVSGRAFGLRQRCYTF